MTGRAGTIPHRLCAMNRIEARSTGCVGGTKAEKGDGTRFDHPLLESNSMIDDASPRYVRRGGSIRLEIPSKNGPSELRPPVEDGIGIIYDEECGALLKHGSRADIEREMERLRAAIGCSRILQPRAVYIDASSIDDRVLDEINACLAIEGRALTLEERLSELLIRSAA